MQQRIRYKYADSLKRVSLKRFSVSQKYQQYQHFLAIGPQKFYQCRKCSRGFITNGPIVTARKRSLGQGNVFTRVCHSVHRGRGSAWRGGGSASSGGCIQGDCLQRGRLGVWLQGGLHLGESASRGVGRSPLGLLTGGSASREGWVDPLPREIHGILWDTVNKQAVRIVLECFLV